MLTSVNLIKNNDQFIYKCTKISVVLTVLTYILHCELPQYVSLPYLSWTAPLERIAREDEDDGSAREDDELETATTTAAA